MDATAHVTGMDSPGVLEITKEIATLMGIESQVTFQSGNTSRELPANTYDMVLFGSLLHYYDPTSATEILRSAYQALKPAGLLVIYAKAVDEERKTDAALLSMIDVSNCAPHGQHYSFTEYKGMLEAAGFRNVNYCEPVIISAEK